MDSDMLVTRDILELWMMKDDRFTIKVVKHEQKPEEKNKMLGQVQTKYKRKNWTSVALFNCAKCRVLTPEYVNTAPAYDLRHLKWLEDDEIGGLPKDWNHLVDVEKFNGVPSNIHYTIGGPWWEHYADCSYADLWKNAHKDMNYVEQLKGGNDV